MIAIHFFEKKLKNLVLFLSLVISWILIEHQCSGAIYDILKNISFSIIAGVVFYYVSIFFPEINNDKKATEHLIDSYRLTKNSIVNALYIALPKDYQNYIDPQDFNNPHFFHRYFFCNRKSLITGKYRYHWETYIKNNKLEAPFRDLIYTELLDFSNYLDKNLNNLILTIDGRNHFSKLQLMIHKLSGPNDPKLLEIILIICTAASLPNYTNHDADFNLKLFRKVDQLEDLRKSLIPPFQYIMLGYLMFWLVFIIELNLT